MFAVLRRRASLSLSARVSLIGTVLIVLACAGVLGLTLLDMRAEMLRRGGAALDRNMRLLRTTLADVGGGPAFRVEGGRLYAGSHVIDEAEPALDRIKDILGGTATIFLGDTRIATTVVNAEGKRAVGTKLAAGPAHDAVLGRRELYRGEAEVLGATYLAAFEPISEPPEKSPPPPSLIHPKVRLSSPCDVSGVQPETTTMSNRPLSLAWNPIRAFAALFVSAVVVGGLALAAAFALMAVTLVLNAGGFLLYALVTGAKILVLLVPAAMILTSGLLGLCRREWA